MNIFKIMSSAYKEKKKYLFGNTLAAEREKADSQLKEVKGKRKDMIQRMVLGSGRNILFTVALD